MQIKALKVFCDIVARRSFSKAAQDNDMSQSGASQIVHQLEEQLGVKLIDRSKRPFILTSEGKVYFEGVKRIVQRFYALEEEVKTLHQDVSGRVSVASIYSIGLGFLSRFVQEFLVQHPKSNVRVEYQHPSRVYEMVNEDRTDFGLVSYPRSSRAVRSVVLYEEPMRMVCSPEHALARNGGSAYAGTGYDGAGYDGANGRRFRLSQLHGVELIGFDRDLRIRTEIDRVLNECHVEPRVVMEFDNIETIKRAIEINMGVSLLPEKSIERELKLGTLVGLEIEGVPLTRPIGMIYRRGKEHGRATRVFMQMLKDQAAAANKTGPLAIESNGAEEKVVEEHLADMNEAGLHGAGIQGAGIDEIETIASTSDELSDEIADVESTVKSAVNADGSDGDWDESKMGQY